MAIQTVNLLWFGNINQLSSRASENVTDPNAKKLVGHKAEGKDQIKAVEVKGDTADRDVFFTTYRTDDRDRPTEMRYESPKTGKVGTGVRIRSFMTASFELEVVNGKGVKETVKQDGVIIQMSNGDLFFRPSTESLSAWDDIKKIISVKVTSAAPAPKGVLPATIGFAPDIFDVDIACFVGGTMILTDRGEITIEELRTGDRVMTKDRGLQKIRWIGSSVLSQAELTAAPRLQPIRISAGALGRNIPRRDLLVSPQHRILLSPAEARSMFGTDEMLIAAKKLLGVEGIEVAEDQLEVTYFHLLTDRHDIIYSEGCETETLYLGPQALDALGAEALEEIRTLFPEVFKSHDAPPMARMPMKGRMIRSLIASGAMQGQLVTLPMPSS